MKKVENDATILRMTYAGLLVLLFPILLLLLSGDWLWPEGLMVGTWFTVLCFALMFYIYRKDSVSQAERVKSHKNFLHKKKMEPNLEDEGAVFVHDEIPENDPTQAAQAESNWDLFVMAGLIVTYVTWMVVMPLDAKRYDWSGTFPLWVKISGGVGLLLAAFFLYRSYTDNIFASSLIWIQKARKKKIVSTGIYGFIRHPMDLGGIIMVLSMPLLLGSLYGIELGIIVVILLVIRIIGEEKMLTKELKGYIYYRKRTRFRLIPYIW